jgi:hypothetical protein
VQKRKPYRTVRRLFSALVLSVYYLAVLVLMLFGYGGYVQAMASHGSLSVKACAWLGLYSLLPVCSMGVFGPLSAKLNEFEMHLTEVICRTKLRELWSNLNNFFVAKRFGCYDLQEIRHGVCEQILLAALHHVLAARRDEAAHRADHHAHE